MRRRLKTTPLRVLSACGVALAFPTVVVGTLAVIGTGEAPATERLLVAGAVLLMVSALLVVPGVPLWLICHWRGVRTWVTALTGGAAGLAAGMGLALITNSGAVEPSVGSTFMTVIFGIGGMGIGAGTCPLMWKIAYPRSLQPRPVAEVFT